MYIFVLAFLFGTKNTLFCSWLFLKTFSHMSNNMPYYFLSLNIYVFPLSHLRIYCSHHALYSLMLLHVHFVRARIVSYLTAVQLPHSGISHWYDNVHLIYSTCSNLLCRCSSFGGSFSQLQDSVCDHMLSWLWNLEQFLSLSLSCIMLIEEYRPANV